MMVLAHNFVHYLDYFTRRDADKFFISVSIRNLALGMVVVFEPAYLYTFFGDSIPSVLLFYALVYGLVAVLAVPVGRLIARLGTRSVILISYAAYTTYYVSLFLFPVSFFFVPLAVLAFGAGVAFYWISFDLDFVRFSSGKSRGGDVGKLNVAAVLPTVVAPAVGGGIVSVFGYPALFVTVLAVLLASSIPLAYVKEKREVYTDTYLKVLKRIFSRERWQSSVAFASLSVEFAVNFLIWPLFMFVAAIGFSAMGGITSFALLASSAFMLYAGRLSDTKERPWLLGVGTVWTSIAWVVKFFVHTPFDAFLAHAMYKTARASASVPFLTFFYEQAAQAKTQADEFVVYRSVVNAVVRSAFLLLLAVAFFAVPSLELRHVFLLAAAVVFGFMFVGNRSRI